MPQPPSLLPKLNRSVYSHLVTKEDALDAAVAEIKKGRKFDQVLAGARDVFLHDGFEGASVDQIARKACVSKATLYSYFPDKRILFLEVAKTECARQADQAIAELDTSRPPRHVLTTTATHMLSFFLSAFGQQVYRTIVAEARRFPELGRDFYDSVHLKVTGTLKDYFREAIGRGELEIEDVDLAAAQFPELCKAHLHPQIILGIRSSFSDEEIARVLNGAVDMFMARYGTEDRR